jgi:hypothetical protein
MQEHDVVYFLISSCNGVNFERIIGEFLLSSCEFLLFLQLVNYHLFLIVSYLIQLAILKLGISQKTARE